MPQREIKASEAVRQSPSSPHGGLLAKTLANFDALFPPPGRPAATEAPQVAPVIGDRGDHRRVGE